MQPAKRFSELISQNHLEESLQLISQSHLEESLQQIISGAYDPRNVLDDASQDENRNPHVRYPDAHIPGI